MAKVLTIRDAQTGHLLAKERLRTKEEIDAAVARVFRETLGPDAPEQKVIAKSILLRDQDWAEELARDWGSHMMMILGPREDPSLERARFVLAAISREPEFPLGKDELNAIKRGRMRDTVIPAIPTAPPDVGDRVRFIQAMYDPFGELLLVPNGDSVLVELTEVRDSGEKWGKSHIYHISWDPAQVKKSLKKVAAQKSK